MTRTDNIPPEPDQRQIATALAAVGLTLLAGGLVAGLVLAAGSLDPRELARTSAWLFPLLMTGIGTLLTAVILRFAAILPALRLRIDAMRTNLPELIYETRGR